jgi:DNA-binding beta-propeller fold protein YncE
MVPAGNVPMGNAIIPQALDTTGLDFFFGIDNTGIDIIATNTSQGPPNAPFSTLCPQPVAIGHTPLNAPFEPLHVNIGQGTFHPINFFVSPDSTQVFIVTSDLGVLVYSFNTESVTAAIPLNGGAAPVAADMTVDGVYLYVAGTDGVLHELDLNQFQDVMEIPFSELPDSSNNFCYASFTCGLNMVVMLP